MPYEEELNTTYNCIHHLPFQFEREHQDVIKLVHDYRMYWKPHQVNTILLAESHKYTELELTEYEHEFNELPEYPHRYCRFVYCLSYGESHRLNLPQGLKITGGTPQYWKLFNEAVNGEYHVNNNTNRANRVQQKIALLRQMQNDGVWLLDTSIMGITSGTAEYDAIIGCSFTNYCLPIIRAEEPQRIVVVGKMVYDRLMPFVTTEFINGYHVDWIHQPNAKVSNANRRTLAHILAV